MDLQAATQNTAELASSQHSDQLLGIAGSKSLIALGDGTKQIQVVTSGMTSALVSDINGPIKIGDKITASPISGVGMKATMSTTIVGTAQSDLPLSGTQTEIITDKKGDKQTVHIASIPLQVNVTYYNVASQNQLSPLVPSFLQTLSNAVVGHQVSALRVIIGFLALMLGFVTAAIMLYSAVRADLIAIGRNPLAQAALQRGLLETVGTAFGVIVLTIIVIYVVLAT